MRRLLFFVLIFSVLLWAANAAAEKYDLYFFTFWFDYISHTLGGIVVAGSFIYFLGLWKHFPKEASVLVFVVAIGAAWEYFELSTGFTRVGDPGYFLDSALDLLFDIFGAHMAYLFARKNLHA